MRVRRPGQFLLYLALAVAADAHAASGVGPPARIVSLDMCADQLLVELVARKRIAAVTHLAADPSLSAIPEKARGIGITRGEAEDVLHYDPDLVLAGPFGVSATVHLLRRLKRNVVIVPQPDDVAGVRQAVRIVAAAVGEETAGEAMISAFDRRLARIAPVRPGAPPPTALVYQIGGSVSGPGSLADAALAAAGLGNMAATYRLSRGDRVSLEALIAHPPQLLVLASAPEDYRTVTADNLRHPAIAELRARVKVLELPWRYWLCGTPHLVEAIERLAAARAEIEGARP